MTSAELLRAAADTLDDGGIPLVNPFLSDHDVTLDQCMALAGQLALGARIVARAISDPKSAAGRAMFNEIAESL